MINGWLAEESQRFAETWSCWPCVCCCYGSVASVCASAEYERGSERCKRAASVSRCESLSVSCGSATVEERHLGGQTDKIVPKRRNSVSGNKTNQCETSRVGSGGDFFHHHPCPWMQEKLQKQQIYQYSCRGCFVVLWQRWSEGEVSLDVVCQPPREANVNNLRSLPNVNNYKAFIPKKAQ